MKPTFRVHFSEEHPNRPGLWLSLRDNFISVLEVDASDLDRDKRERNWLDGEWGAHLEKVDRDLVPLDRKKIQEHIDKLITHANENAKTDVRDALQNLRASVIGTTLDLPQDDLGQGEPRPVEEVREPERSATGDDERML